MEGIIQSFYIDWQLMLAQLINFSIVIFVLWKFAYKPILNILKDRSEKIGKSLEDAKKIEKSLENTKNESERIIREASSRGQSIVEESTQNAENLKKDKMEETRAESQKIIETAKDQIRGEREKMMSELKRELGELVMLASDKITRGKISPEVNEKLIEEVLEDLQKEEIKSV